jgi:hypothetical protein
MTENEKNGLDVLKGFCIYLFLKLKYRARKRLNRSRNSPTETNWFGDGKTPERDSKMPNVL